MATDVKTTTCYMCACRCGIKVHLDGNKVRYIEGNKDHPINKGVLCAKGSAGIMHHNSPARLTGPLKRVGPRGSGEFEEISWDEALETATTWLSNIRARDPRRLAFFTGRDQSQAMTGYWASQFGTPNFAAHGGFCSVNMAAAGLYSIGGSFWEFGEPDWEKTRYFLMFGVAEDHDSNPIKAGLGKLKTGGRAKFVSVNPVRTGYSAIADEWVGIKPGTDGLFVLALIHELMRTRKIDLDYLVRYTNAHWLVSLDEDSPEHGLFIRDGLGNPLAWDNARGLTVGAHLPSINPALAGEFELPGGARVAPVLHLMAQRYLAAENAPDAVADKCGVPAGTIRRIAAELAQAAFSQEITLDIPWTDWVGRKHSKTTGRPVAMHAMRGISAHANGFQTCRALHVLQMLLGSIDCPGGSLYKAPFPKPVPPGPKPVGKPSQVNPDTPMPGMPLGFPQEPKDLLVEADGSPARLDKAFSWEYPLAAHGMMHMVIRNAWAGDPYPIDTLFMYMANMGWNSSMNTGETIAMLTDKNEETGDYKIPHIIYSDAFYSETVAYADLILPDTTYLERWDVVSMLDRPISSADGPADAIRQPVVKPDRNVLPFQDVLIDLGARLGLPAFTNSDGGAKFPGGYADYIVNHERAPGIGSLAGWRGASGTEQGRGAVNPKQLDAYIENGCFWRHELPPEHRYYRHANGGYLRYAFDMGWIAHTGQITLQLYCEPLQRFRLAANGHGPVQPPDEHRGRVATYFDPLPFWFPPFDDGGSDGDGDDLPLHAITQRPMAMYHSWGSQNAWLRQIHGQNRLFINSATAAKLGLVDDDWVWIENGRGRVKGQIKCMEGCNPDTVWTWNAIGKRRGAWNLDEDAPEATKGFLLNHLIADILTPKGESKGRGYSNSDPITGQAAWFDLKVRIVKALPEEVGEAMPQFDPLPVRDVLDPPPTRLGGVIAR